MAGKTLMSLPRNSAHGVPGRVIGNRQNRHFLAAGTRTQDCYQSPPSTPISRALPHPL